jgi:hypothetical protein
MSLILQQNKHMSPQVLFSQSPEAHYAVQQCDKQFHRRG